MQDDSLQKRLKSITDFVAFEAETSTTWPWALPAEKLLQSDEKLLTVAQSIHLDDDDACDTDEMYDALDRVFGINPTLVGKE